MLLLSLADDASLGALSSLLADYGFDVAGRILTADPVARVNLHAVRRAG